MAILLQSGDPVPRLVLQGPPLAIADFAGDFLLLAVGDGEEMRALLASQLPRTLQVVAIAPSGASELGDPRRQMRVDKDGTSARRLGRQGHETMFILLDPVGVVLRSWLRSDGNELGNTLSHYLGKFKSPDEQQ